MYTNLYVDLLVIHQVIRNTVFSTIAGYSWSITKCISLFYWFNSQVCPKSCSLGNIWITNLKIISHSHVFLSNLFCCNAELNPWNEFQQELRFPSQIHLLPSRHVTITDSEEATVIMYVHLWITLLQVTCPHLSYRPATLLNIDKRYCKVFLSFNLLFKKNNVYNISWILVQFFKPSLWYVAVV